jgi:Zn-dependent peptidase ImmA (M78 family)
LLSDTLVDPAERAWAIAHELGHYEMKHDAPPASELCVPRPRRPGDRAERDQEDEANEWAMMFTMRDADVAPLCDRMPMTLDPVLRLARRCGSLRSPPRFV